MKFLSDFFPVILFFIAFKVSDIFVATGVAIAASVLQIGWALVRRHKVTTMQWVGLIVIVVFGGATLISHNETFIKWKPTVLYWVGATVFIGALAFRRNLVKALMGEGIDLPEPVWTKLAIAWGVFFFLNGALNLWVAFNFSTDVWVNFKLFGGMGLTLAFVIAQAFWISRHMPDEGGKREATEGEG